MVAIERDSSGRPSIDIGIPPSPIALTSTSTDRAGLQLCSCVRHHFSPSVFRRSVGAAAATRRSARARSCSRGRSRRAGSSALVVELRRRAAGPPQSSCSLRARADDRRRHARAGAAARRARRRPARGRVRRRSPRMPRSASRCVAGRVGGAALEPALAVALLAQHAAEQPAVQRRPRDDAEAVVLRGRQHLELDVAGHQVVDRLLADQPGEVAVGAPRPAPARCASRRSCCCPRRGSCPALTATSMACQISSHGVPRSMWWNW